MKTITLNNTNLNIPEIGMGCMRINGLETAEAEEDLNQFIQYLLFAKKNKQAVKRAFTIKP